MVLAKKKIVYPAVPSRLSNEIWGKILAFIRKEGHVPFDHRLGVPFNDFERGLGRGKTLKFLIDIMKQCDAVWIFGMSEGVLGEFKTALDMRDSGSDIEVAGFYGFDPEWDRYYRDLGQKYGDPITRFRGKNRLIALVGQRAVGKTFLIDRLVGLAGHNVGRIKNTTTRKPRDKRDHLSYSFISKREFRRRLQGGYFLESDVYRGEYYGSCMASIQETLRVQDGIFAITPPGAEKLYEKSFGINLSIILLQPESDAVLRRNLVSRGITDPLEQQRILQTVSQFALPVNIPHKLVKLCGDADVDMERLLFAAYTES